MHIKGMVKGLLNCSYEFDFCEHCIYVKQNHVSFLNKDTRARIILELVHSDVFEPVSSPSLRGSRYYVSFIDNLSKMIWIFYKQEFEGI